MDNKRHDLAGFVAYVNGAGQLGTVSGFKHPELEMQGEWASGSGLSAQVFRRFHQVGELKASMTFKDINRAMAATFGLSGQTITVRAAIVDQTNVTTNVRVTLRGTASKVDRGEWKQGEATEESYDFALSYYRYEVGGDVVDEVDPERGILIIGGNDLRASINSALGLTA